MPNFLANFSDIVPEYSRLSPGLSPTFSLAPQDVALMLISPNVKLTDEVRRFLYHAKPFDNSILALRQMVERSLHAKHFFTYNKYSIPHQIRRSSSDEVTSLFFFQLTLV